MELDKNLVNLQGTLYSFWMQGFLNKPDKLHQVLNGIKQITDSVPNDAKSKLTFLMVLYTRLSVSEELKYDKFVGHCLNTDPYIQKEYLITYLYHLDLQQELFKVIENFPGALGLELLDEIIKKLKAPNFHKDEFGFEHIYQLWQSIFVKLCKLDKKLHKEKYSENFTNCFQDVYELIEQILITSMNAFDCNEFVGLNLYHFFKTLLFFIMLHKTPRVSNDPLYDLSIEFDMDDSNTCCDGMKNSINKVFEKISNILKSLTIDMWMFFSECYYPGSKNSLQLLIGDLVYSILKEVEPYVVPSDVLNFLSSIAINKLELIEKADIEKIISNIRNGEKEWFQGLLRPSAFMKIESVKCLIDHLELANSEDLNGILKTCYEYLCSDTSDQDDRLPLIKKLFLAALKKMPDCSKWLEIIFETYRPTLLCTDETHTELVETFNKISKGSNIPDCDLILLCVQSPLETIKRISHIAVYGSEQTNFIIKVLKLLPQPCKVSYSESFTLLDYVLLKSLLEELTVKEKQSFLNLVIHLGTENLLGSSFHNNLLKCVKEYLENEVLEKAVICLEILNAILDLKIFNIHNIVLLVFMAQILGHFSWDLRSFSITKSVGRDLADSIVTSIIGGLEEKENYSDLQWARQEIIKLEEINQAYFCDLWFKFNCNWIGSGSFHSLILALAHSQHKTDDLRNFLIKFDEASEVRTSIILSLTLLLPVLTFRKWNSVFHHLTIAWRDINYEKHDADVCYCILDLFGTALQMLSMNLKQEEDTFPCFKYCLRNFGRLTKECCSKMNEKSLLLSFEKIFLILGVIKDDKKRKLCWEIFPPVLMELVERLKKKNAVETVRNDIQVLLSLLDLKDIGEALLKKLQ